MTAGAGLGRLAALEVEGLRLADLVPGEAETRRGELIEVTRRAVNLLIQE